MKTSNITVMQTDLIEHQCIFIQNFKFSATKCTTTFVLFLTDEKELIVIKLENESFSTSARASS